MFDGRVLTAVREFAHVAMSARRPCASGVDDLAKLRDTELNGHADFRFEYVDPGNSCGTANRLLDECGISHRTVLEDG